jgi:GNAT superfamily N-acetyltransferase
MRISRARPAVARAQASWIADIEPWRGLGYLPAALGRYLARMAGNGDVWIAASGDRGKPLGIVVATDGFLLGGFIALLAVRPDAAGQGIGQALVGRVARVGRLPDLVRQGRVELLLRKAAPLGPSRK